VLIERLAGINLSMVPRILTDAGEEVAVCRGGSVLVGSARGGAPGRVRTPSHRPCRCRPPSTPPRSSYATGALSRPASSRGLNDYGASLPDNASVTANFNALLALGSESHFEKSTPRHTFYFLDLSFLIS
jgi:hypothetical protein